MAKSRIQLGGLHLIPFQLCIQDETWRAVTMVLCPSALHRGPVPTAAPPEHAMGMLVPTQSASALRSPPLQADLCRDVPPSPLHAPFHQL